MDIFADLVNNERCRQDEQWGEQNHSSLYWYTILGEEVGELAKAILELNNKDIETELVQVAAVCKVIWESGKRNNWL